MPQYLHVLSTGHKEYSENKIYDFMNSIIIRDKIQSLETLKKKFKPLDSVLKATHTYT